MTYATDSSLTHHCFAILHSHLTEVSMVKIISVDCDPLNSLF